jgi:hypothetical protein
MTKRLLVGLLFCVSLLTFVLPGRTQADRDSDPLVKLEKAGWKIVQDGVLQRQAKPHATETFVFGVEGFTWKLQELSRQMEVLRRELKANPTPELRRAIASHRRAIASTRKAIQRARTAEARGEAIRPKTCTINFTYTADASYKTDREGTWAEANADFTSPSECGFSGEVYAYAFAKTTVNGAPSTATVTDGPRSGATVNASADANRNGGEPCESYAFASVTSNDLNPTSYSVSQENFLCSELILESGGGGGRVCPVCTVYADGSQCCETCSCYTMGVQCTETYCPQPQGCTNNCPPPD